MACACRSRASFFPPKLWRSGRMGARPSVYYVQSQMAMLVVSTARRNMSRFGGNIPRSTCLSKSWVGTREEAHFGRCRAAAAVLHASTDTTADTLQACMLQLLARSCTKQ
jgi:hypothetical protein